MGVLPDWMIERDIKIEPLASLEHRPGAISYGVTSYGYTGYGNKVYSPYFGPEIGGFLARLP